MNFYNTTHLHYCGIDLHTRSLYVCIIDHECNTLLHKEVPANPESLYQLIEPYRDDLIMGVECMHCWYWVADFCEDHGIHFILGHALYMKAIHGGNFPLAYVYPQKMRVTRDLLRRRTRIVRHGADLKAHIINTTSQYNLPPNKVNLKNVCAREQLKSTFENREAQRNIDLDLNILECVLCILC